MKKQTKIAIIVALALVVIIGLVLWRASVPNTKQTTAEPVVNTTPTTLANPASVNCLQKGGKLEMRANKNGQYGVCLFEDNRQCEEWALMRGECPAGGLKITGYDNDAEIYCAITGGKVEGVGTKTPMCKRTDGTDY